MHTDFCAFKRTNWPTQLRQQIDLLQNLAKQWWRSAGAPSLQPLQRDVFRI